MSSMAEKPILIHEEEDNEHPPLPTKSPASARPTHPSVLMRSCPSRTRIEKVPAYVFRNSFQEYVL